MNSPDEDISSPLIFDNSQQTPTTPTDHTNTNQMDTILPTALPPGATTSQFSVFSQSQTTRRLRRQPVTDYRTHKPPSEIYFHS